MSFTFLQPPHLWPNLLFGVTRHLWYDPSPLYNPHLCYIPHRWYNPDLWCDL